jgi:hypothetical protein
MWLHQDTIDNVDVDRSAVGRSNGFEHCGQAQIATPTKNAICRTNDELRRTSRERTMR